MTDTDWPKRGSHPLHCPHCNVIAYHNFEKVLTYFSGSHIGTRQSALKFENQDVFLSTCIHCKKPAIWVLGKLVFPSTAVHPVANEDMPDNVKEVFNEAGAIVSHSPRAACALLRLALEMLLKHLGGSGNINRAIENLDKKGLDPGTREAMHVLRVIGNQAIHAGTIRVDEDSDTEVLFELLNDIVLELITLPRKRAELFNSLPESDRKYIEKKESETN